MCVHVGEDKASRFSVVEHIDDYFEVAANGTAVTHLSCTIMRSSII